MYQICRIQTRDVVAFDNIIPQFRTSQSPHTTVNLPDLKLVHLTNSQPPQSNFRTSQSPYKIVNLPFLRLASPLH